MNHGFQEYLQNWFKSGSGQAALNQEKRLLDNALKNLFGYYLVQLGCIAQSNLVKASRISHKVVIAQQSIFINSNLEELQWIQADLDFLPVAKDKVDVVVLPHTLEAFDDPYYLLRQVDNMLVAEGHMVISGFNPMGCLPVRFKFMSKKKDFRPPSITRAGRIKEWLEVLGYEVKLVEYSPVMCFAANEKYPRWGRFVEKLEKSLQKLGIEFGNIYCLVAKKKVDAPTLVGLKWHLPRWQSIKNRGTVAQRFNEVPKQSSNYKRKIDKNADC